jgi:hypothetical protein
MSVHGSGVLFVAIPQVQHGTRLEERAWEMCKNKDTLDWPLRGRGLVTNSKDAAVVLRARANCSARALAQQQLHALQARVVGDDAQEPLRRVR